MDLQPCRTNEQAVIMAWRVSGLPTQFVGHRRGEGASRLLTTLFISFHVNCTPSYLLTTVAARVEDVVGPVQGTTILLEL